VTKLLATSRFTEFGEPVSGSAGRYGWLGGKARRTELSSGVIQMGARSYIPQLGRFLTPDPVRGGSANPYDYANQDPVNQFDLDGLCPQVAEKGGFVWARWAGQKREATQADRPTRKAGSG
jgi:RHS repeat-associated protein